MGDERRLGTLGRYRVEHRTATGTVVLNEADECFAHHAPLARYASWLRLGGRADGELALVDPATDRVVARLDLTRPPRRPGGASARDGRSRGGSAARSG